MKIYGLSAEERNTRLATAAERGSIDVVKKLIEMGVDVNASYKYYTQLRDIIPEQIKHVITVTGLPDSFREVRNSRYGNFNTALMLAVKNGHHQCAELLVDAGADVNKANMFGLTALMNAGFLMNNSRCYEILMKAGADVNVVDVAGQTALHFATFFNNHEGLGTLLEAGANVNAFDVKDSTALIRAAWFLSYECIDLLVKAGADVNKVEDYGRTALMSIGFGAMWHDYKCVYRLLQAGSHVIKCQHYYAYDMNASEQHIASWGINCRNEKILRALHAAGEIVEGNDVRKLGYNYVQELNTPEGNLKDTCRRAIRKHLMDLSPLNLFCKIPHLGLPKLMERYLLYGVTLDDTNDGDSEINMWDVKTRSSSSCNSNNDTNSSSCNSSTGTGNNKNCTKSSSKNKKANSSGIGKNGSSSRKGSNGHKTAEVGSSGPHVSKYGRRSRKPDRLNISQ